MTQLGDTQPNMAVAIVGIGCRFPGGASDPDSFWRLLKAGVDAITEIPADRMDISHYFNPAPATPGHVMSRWGGFLEGIDTLDADFFGISPREAERLDPQQRLLLETAWEALEDAGQDLHRLTGQRGGIFVGQWTSDFEARLFADPAAVDFQMTTGSGRYAASGRLSYFLDWRGPSLTIDTACSSSLAAVHLAVRSIRAGESRIALAGGVNVILQPHVNIAYSQSRMMAPDGRCKFGDASGDGYVRSEGAGLVVLKALCDAMTDGDRIYAVIRGSAVNNDGHSSGSMGTPSRIGQEELLRAAYEDAGVPGGRVGYVEAHGTGTRVGDPVELAALGAVLGQERTSGSRVYVGSVKTNIGHTEGAAGVAGLIKAALAMQRGAVPPSLHCREPNPAIPWSSIPCEIARTQLSWPDDGLPRVAGVSGFGIGGTNAHVVLEEAPATPPTSDPETGRAEKLLPLSAKSPEALRALALRYAGLLSAENGPTLRDACWSAATRRTALDHRAAFVAADQATMADALRRYGTGEAAAAEGTVHAAERPRIAFVLPGQGAQWIGMGRQLNAREPVFRAALERCDQAARPFIDWSILQQLHATPGSDDFLLDRIDVIQPTLVALAIAYAELLCSMGIEPDAVVGHSMGEVAAACIAGILDLDQAMSVICRRSALMRQVSGQGAMALVDLAMDDLRTRLTGLEDRVSVAASNGPRSSVISGVPETVAQVMADLTQEDVFCRLVKVDVASHSPQMDPLAVELAAELAGMKPGEARVPIYSTVLGRPADGQEFAAGYWARNIREPVLFATAVNQMLEAGVTIFLELGPHPILLASVQHTAPTAITIACGRRGDPEQAAFLTALGALWSAGYPVDWHRLMPEGGRAVTLPLYPWQRERHWAEAAEMRPAGSTSRSLGLRPDDATRSWLYQLEWQAAPAAETTPNEAALEEAAIRWLVVGGDDTLGSTIVAAFGSAGARAEAVPLSQFEVVFARQAGSTHPAQRIVVLADDGPDTAFLPLRVLQSYLASAWHPGPRLWFVTRGAQSVGPGATERVSVDQAALWGAGRVIAEEHPDLWGGMADLDQAATPSANATLLVRELLSTDGGENQVSLRLSGRYVLRLTRTNRGLAFTGPAWRADGAYLITGGLGGIGLRIAAAMAADGARRIILLGRTILPPREQWTTMVPDSVVGQRIAAVRALEAMGVAVHTPAVDVGNETELRAFLDRYSAEAWPPVRGVIHTAVSLDNSLATSMTRTTFDAVLQSKLRGAQLLDQLLPDLDVFVLFSSIGSFLPHPGIANYAAANAGLDALAQDRRARGLPALSIAWGPWEQAGLALGEAGEHAVIEMARLGIQAIPTERGITLFGQICDGSGPTTTVMPTDWSRFRQARGWRQETLFHDLIADLPTASPEQSTLLRQLETAGPEERRQLLRDTTRSAISRVLKIVPSRIDNRKTLGNMGLNSLMAIELRNQLEAALGRPISATLAWNHPTVDAIVRYLADDGTDAPERPNAIMPQRSPPDELSKSLLDVAAMSDEAAMLSLLGQSAEAAQ